MVEWAACGQKTYSKVGWRIQVCIWDTQVGKTETTSLKVDLQHLAFSFNNCSTFKGAAAAHATLNDTTNSYMVYSARIMWISLSEARTF